MEFVDGCAMMGMPAHLYLKEERKQASLWFELGRLMGFDLLINNFDRLPLAWSNEGNLGNIMLGSRTQSVVAVDQSVRPITHPDGLRNYLDRVKVAAIEARDGDGKSFKRVKEAIYNNTAIELSPEEVASLRSGCLEFLEDIVHRAASDEMDAILDDVSRSVADELLWPEDSEAMTSCCQLVHNVVQALHEALGVTSASENSRD
jgi:hypothetical protein